MRVGRIVSQIRHGFSLIARFVGARGNPVLEQKPEHDVTPIRVKERPNVIDPRCDPNVIRTWVSIHNAANDRLGHSLIQPVDDREKRRINITGSLDGINLIRVEPRSPLRGSDRQRNDGNPGRPVIEKLRVVGDRIAIGVVGSLDNHRPHVRLAGRSEENRDRAHRMPHEHDPLGRKSCIPEVLHRGADVLTLQPAKRGVTAFAASVTTKTRQKDRMPTLHERSSMPLITLEGAPEPMNDDKRRLVFVATSDPSAKRETTRIEIDGFVAHRQYRRHVGGMRSRHDVRERERQSDKDRASIQ